MAAVAWRQRRQASQAGTIKVRTQKRRSGPYIVGITSHVNFGFKQEVIGLEPARGRPSDRREPRSTITSNEDSYAIAASRPDSGLGGRFFWNDLRTVRAADAQTAGDNAGDPRCGGSAGLDIQGA